MRKIVALFLAIAMFAVMLPIASAASVEEKRQSARNAAVETLERLYKAQPEARGAVEKNAGYAVFNNVGMKILVAGGGKGKGIAVNNIDNQETFMRMAEVQVGLGFGVKEFSVIFVFETEEALQNFIDQGWEYSGQATVAATDNVNGASMQGAASVSPGVWMYQLTTKGLAAEITIKGTKYYKDDELN